MLLAILQIWTIYIQVVVTPISSPVVLFVYVGDTAELICPVQHNGRDGQWFRLKSDGTDSIDRLLAIGDTINLSFKGNERFTAYRNLTAYILRINSIEKDDAGRYQCHISGIPVLEFRIELLSEEDVSSTGSYSDVTHYDSTSSLSPDIDSVTLQIIILSGSGIAVLLIISIIVKCVCSANRGQTTTADQRNSQDDNHSSSAYPMYEEVRSTNNEFVSVHTSLASPMYEEVRSTNNNEFGSGEDQMRRQEEITGFIGPEGRLYRQNIRNETQLDMYESLSTERSDVHIYKDISSV